MIGRLWQALTDLFARMAADRTVILSAIAAHQRHVDSQFSALARYGELLVMTTKAEIDQKLQDLTAKVQGIVVTIGGAVNVLDESHAIIVDLRDQLANTGGLSAEQSAKLDEAIASLSGAKEQLAAAVTTDDPTPETPALPADDSGTVPGDGLPADDGAKDGSGQG